jgi:spore coat polysaccharide biosynthesis protein SpsF
VDEVVVATSTKQADDIIARYAFKYGAVVFRGSESDVLDRMYQAAAQENADIVVRITGDCPLVDPDVVDKVVERLVETNADYSTNTLERTFPRGLDVEAFTLNSFECVHKEATDPHHREHVTPYYHEHNDLFTRTTITSEDVFDDSWMHDRTDLRLTLDEADDYELLRVIYESMDYNELVDIRDAVQYIDDNNIAEINENVKQKST